MDNKINHIAMYVKDLDGAKKFFEKYFGAVAGEKYHNKNTGFQSYFLEFGGGNVRLEIMSKLGVEKENESAERLGFIHIAFSVGSKERVDELTKILESDGYKVVSGPRTTGDGYYESLIIGIEGNMIEITV